MVKRRSGRRYVRTPEGSEKYGLPIGALITKDAIERAQILGHSKPVPEDKDSGDSPAPKRTPRTPDQLAQAIAKAPAPRLSRLRGPQKVDVGGHQYSVPNGSKVFRVSGENHKNFAFLRTPDYELHVLSDKGVAFELEGELEKEFNEKFDLVGTDEDTHEYTKDGQSTDASSDTTPTSQSTKPTDGETSPSADREDSEKRPASEEADTESNQPEPSAPSAEESKRLAKINRVEDVPGFLTEDRIQAMLSGLRSNSLTDTQRDLVELQFRRNNDQLRSEWESARKRYPQSPTEPKTAEPSESHDETQNSKSKPTPPQVDKPSPQPKSFVPPQRASKPEGSETSTPNDFSDEVDALDADARESSFGVVVREIAGRHVMARMNRANDRVSYAVENDDKTTRAITREDLLSELSSSPRTPERRDTTGLSASELTEEELDDLIQDYEDYENALNLDMDPELQRRLEDLNAESARRAANPPRARFLEDDEPPAIKPEGVSRREASRAPVGSIIANSDGLVEEKDRSGAWVSAIGKSSPARDLIDADPSEGATSSIVREGPAKDGRPFGATQRIHNEKDLKSVRPGDSLVLRTKKGESVLRRDDNGSGFTVSMPGGLTVSVTRQDVESALQHIDREAWLVPNRGRQTLPRKLPSEWAVGDQVVPTSDVYGLPSGAVVHVGDAPGGVRIPMRPGDFVRLSDGRMQRTDNKTQVFSADEFASATKGGDVRVVSVPKAKDPLPELPPVPDPNNAPSGEKLKKGAPITSARQLRELPAGSTITLFVPAEANGGRAVQVALIRADDREGEQFMFRFGRGGRGYNSFGENNGQLYQAIFEGRVFAGDLTRAEDRFPSDYIDGGWSKERNISLWEGGPQFSEFEIRSFMQALRESSAFQVAYFDGLPPENPFHSQRIRAQLVKIAQKKYSAEGDLWRDKPAMIRYLSEQLGIPYIEPMSALFSDDLDVSDFRQRVSVGRPLRNTGRPAEENMGPEWLEVSAADIKNAIAIIDNMRVDPKDREQTDKILKNEFQRRGNPLKDMNIAVAVASYFQMTRTYDGRPTTTIARQHDKLRNKELLKQMLREQLEGQPPGYYGIPEDETWRRGNGSIARNHSNLSPVSAEAPSTPERSATPNTPERPTGSSTPERSTTPRAQAPASMVAGDGRVHSLSELRDVPLGGWINVVHSDSSPMWAFMRTSRGSFLGATPKDGYVDGPFSVDQMEELVGHSPRIYAGFRLENPDGVSAISRHFIEGALGENAPTHSFDKLHELPEDSWAVTVGTKSKKPIFVHRRHDGNFDVVSSSAESQGIPESEARAILANNASGFKNVLLSNVPDNTINRAFGVYTVEDVNTPGRIFAPSQLALVNTGARLTAWREGANIGSLQRQPDGSYVFTNPSGNNGVDFSLDELKSEASKLGWVFKYENGGDGDSSEPAPSKPGALDIGEVVSAPQGTRFRVRSLNGGANYISTGNTLVMTSMDGSRGRLPREIRVADGPVRALQDVGFVFEFGTEDDRTDQPPTSLNTSPEVQTGEPVTFGQLLHPRDFPNIPSSAEIAIKTSRGAISLRRLSNGSFQSTRSGGEVYTLEHVMQMGEGRDTLVMDVPEISPKDTTNIPNLTNPAKEVNPDPSPFRVGEPLLQEDVVRLTRPGIVIGYHRRTDNRVSRYVLGNDGQWRGLNSSSGAVARISEWRAGTQFWIYSHPDKPDIHADSPVARSVSSSTNSDSTPTAPSTPAHLLPARGAEIMPSSLDEIPSGHVIFVGRNFFVKSGNLFIDHNGNAHFASYFQPTGSGDITITYVGDELYASSLEGVPFLSGDLPSVPPGRDIVTQTGTRYRWDGTALHALGVDGDSTPVYPADLGDTAVLSARNPADPNTPVVGTMLSESDVDNLREGSMLVSGNDIFTYMDGEFHDRTVNSLSHLPSSAIYMGHEDDYDLQAHIYPGAFVSPSVALSIPEGHSVLVGSGGVSAVLYTRNSSGFLSSAGTQVDLATFLTYTTNVRNGGAHVRYLGDTAPGSTRALLDGERISGLDVLRLPLGAHVQFSSGVMGRRATGGVETLNADGSVRGFVSDLDLAGSPYGFLYVDAGATTPAVTQGSAPTSAQPGNYTRGSALLASDIRALPAGTVISNHRIRWVWVGDGTLRSELTGRIRDFSTMSRNRFVFVAGPNGADVPRRATSAPRRRRAPTTRVSRRGAQSEATMHDPQILRNPPGTFVPIVDPDPSGFREHFPTEVEVAFDRSNTSLFGDYIQTPTGANDFRNAITSVLPPGHRITALNITSQSFALTVTNQNGARLTALRSIGYASDGTPVIGNSEQHNEERGATPGLTDTVQKALYAFYAQHGIKRVTVHGVSGGGWTGSMVWPRRGFYTLDLSDSYAEVGPRRAAELLQQNLPRIPDDVEWKQDVRDWISDYQVAQTLTREEREKALGLLWYRLTRLGEYRDRNNRPVFAYGWSLIYNNRLPFYGSLSLSDYYGFGRNN